MKKLFTIALFLLAALNAITYSQENSAEKTKRMKPALLVIDIQNAYLPHMDQSEKDMAMENINFYIDFFRQKGYPIIRVYHTDLQNGPKPDTDLFEFPSTVSIKKDDAKVIKNYGDAFNKTDLDKVLKEKGCNTVFLCGLSATGCVLATYIGASNHDYDAFLLKDALISHKSEYTKNIEAILGAINYFVVKVMLDNAQK